MASVKMKWESFLSETMVIHGPDVARVCREIVVEHELLRKVNSNKLSPKEVLEAALKRLDLLYSGHVAFNSDGT